MQVTLRRSRTALVGLIAACGLMLAVCEKDSTGPTNECPAPVPGVGLVVEAPNGCDSYTVGDSMVIDWEIDSVKDGVLIEFSANNGLSFMIIGNALKGNPNYEHGPYKWAIPDTAYRSDGLTSVYTVSDSCLIRVKEYWALNIRDVSDRTFSIRARP